MGSILLNSQTIEKLSKNRNKEEYLLPFPLNIALGVPEKHNKTKEK